MVAAPQKEVSRAGFGCAAGAAASASPGAFAAAQAGDAPPEDFPTGGSLSKLFIQADAPRRESRGVFAFCYCLADLYSLYLLCRFRKRQREGCKSLAAAQDGEGDAGGVLRHGIEVGGVPVSAAGLIDRFAFGTLELEQFAGVGT